MLANGSPVFAAMWTSGAREATSCHVELDAEPEVATVMLRYLYGLRAAVPLQQLPALWMLADYYQVGVPAGSAVLGPLHGCCSDAPWPEGTCWGCSHWQAATKILPLAGCHQEAMDVDVCSQVLQCMPAAGPW
jgi:hypothetical protein